MNAKTIVMMALGLSAALLSAQLKLFALFGWVISGAITMVIVQERHLSAAIAVLVSALTMVTIVVHALGGHVLSVLQSVMWYLGLVLFLSVTALKTQALSTALASTLLGLTALCIAAYPLGYFDNAFWQAVWAQSAVDATHTQPPWLISLIQKSIEWVAVHWIVVFFLAALAAWYVGALWCLKHCRPHIEKTPWRSMITSVRYSRGFSIFAGSLLIITALLPRMIDETGIAHLAQGIHALYVAGLAVAGITWVVSRLLKYKYGPWGLGVVGLLYMVQPTLMSYGLVSIALLDTWCDLGHRTE